MPVRIGARTPTHGARRTPGTALAVFFVTAFALSWTVWGTALAFERGLLSWHLGEPLAFVSVTIAAVVASLVAAGPAGLRHWWARMTRFRVAARWYVLAIALPALPIVLAVVAYLALGGDHDLHALVPLAAALPLLASQFVLHWLTEESGWRGVALPLLRTRHSALTASLLLGIAWALWHLPLFALSSSRQTYPLLGFVLLVVAMSVLMTALHEASGGSVPIAGLFHASMNTTFAVLNALWGPSPLFWTCVAVTVVVAAVVGATALRTASGRSLPEVAVPPPPATTPIA